MNRKYTLLFLVLCIFFWSCKKKSKPDVGPITPDIYLAGGSQAANGNYIAQYWKNDKVVELINVNYPLAGGFIAVSGTDIHVVNQAYRLTYMHGLYWKNGTSIAFSKNPEPEYVSDLAVSGQNVYIVGIPSQSPRYAAYWKNGEAVIYPDAVNGSASGISLSGNDVYLAGSVSVGGKRVASYWRNGNRVSLASDTDSSFAFAITTRNSDVHVVGQKGSHYAEKNYYATYWKNGVEVSLTDHSEDYSVAKDIAIAGNDVYIVGYVKKGNTKEAKIWKNGVPSTLPSGNTVSSIFVFNDDIYVTGSGGGSFDGGRAMYWKNATPIFLSDGTRNVWVSSIFVKNP
jgi:hypothetical protein